MKIFHKAYRNENGKSHVFLDPKFGIWTIAKNLGGSSSRWFFTTQEFFCPAAETTWYIRLGNNQIRPAKKLEWKLTLDKVFFHIFGQNLDFFKVTLVRSDAISYSLFLAVTYFRSDTVSKLIFLAVTYFEVIFFGVTYF